MKILLETEGPFSYVDPITRSELSSFRPSVVQTSEFINTLTAGRKVKIIENELMDEATDEEFKKFWVESDKDRSLAIDSFLAKFSAKPKLVENQKKDEKKAGESKKD